MKHLLFLVILVSGYPTANAELSLKEIRTASDSVLVAYFKSTVVQADEVNTADPSSWKLNGQPVAAINKFVTEADRCDHHIYVQAPTSVPPASSWTMRKV